MSAMGVVSRKKPVKGSHDSAATALDQSLPALRLGSRNWQWWLYLLPCLVALLCSLLSLLVDWRAALLVFAVASAWGLGSCPWTRARRAALPRLLSHRGDDQVSVRLQNGERREGSVRAGGVYAYRFLLLRLATADGQRMIVMAVFRPGETRWRQWRLIARRHWLAAAPSRAAGANAGLVPADRENRSRNDNRAIRGAAEPPG